MRYNFYDVKFRTHNAPVDEVKTTILTVASAKDAEREFTNRYPYMTFLSATIMPVDLNFYPGSDGL